MATYAELRRQIIEFHEKLNYDESTAIRPRVLDALNRGIKAIWSKCDWTFRVQQSEMEYDPEGDDNSLPDNFLSFQHTGRVILMGSDGQPQRNLEYMPFNQMMLNLKGSRITRGTPECYSLGGPINGGGNQRSIFLFPVPNDVVDLRLIFQTVAPQGTEATINDEIEGIPATWHDVVREMAVLFRLMDKSADISGQTQLVNTLINSMMRDEPHGREDTPKMQGFMSWRMNIRY